MRQRIFLQQSTFSADSPTVSVHPRVQSHAQDKDPVVHVRVQWVMETLKHPECTVAWVARFCRGWLSPGKAIRTCHEGNHNGTILSKTFTGKCLIHYSCHTFNADWEEIKFNEPERLNFDSSQSTLRFNSDLFQNLLERISNALVFKQRVPQL